MIALLAALLAVTPSSLSASAADSIRHAIEQERLQDDEWLKSGETSYLAAVERRDFGSRATLRVGRAPDNDIRLKADSVAAHQLEVTVAGDSFRVVALDPGASFVAGKVSVRRAVVGPSSIHVGRFTLRLSHQRYPAIIVFDPQSPRLRDYKGLRYYPVDLDYRFVVPLLPNPKADTVIILSTRGNRRRALRVGWFAFKAGSTSCRLEATRLLEPGVDESSVSVFFRDATSGKDTYGVGRYLDPERLHDGRYVLDFNLAYNPACAFSPDYNCPLPPQGNTLAIAIRAGEMDSHYADH